jgi:gliding motility-associated-like protein
VTDANTCSAITSRTVTVNPLPTATISPLVARICIGDSDTLTAGGGTGYVWSTTSNSPSLIVSPTATTTYSVSVTDANSCSTTASRTVTVNPLPTPAVNPTTVAICIGAGTTLTGAGGISYVWSTTAATPTITASPITTTTYSITATDANSCSAIATATVAVNPLPTAVINPVTDICLGASATLTAGGGVSYVWSTTATTDTITVSPTVTTTYTVSVTDTNHCTNTTSKAVTVIPPMTLSSTITNVSCNGGADGAIALTISSGRSPYSYLWNPAASTSTINSLTMGTYAVSVTDFAGCSVTASYAIAQPPILSLTSSLVDPTCETIKYDGSITLNVTGGTVPYQFLWSNNASDQNLINITTGTYTVIVNDAHNCTTGSTFSLTYIYDFTVHATPSDSINLGDSTLLGYTLTGNVGTFSNLWSPATTLSCTDCVTPVAAPYANTLYHIQVKNDLGCVATDSVMIYVIPNYDIYIPNAFTPNGDAVNDLFQIYGNIKALKFLEIQIFNRWGEVVFKSNDLNFYWDGTYKGVLQEPGIFVWQLDLTFINGHDVNKKGSLTLIR